MECCSDCMMLGRVLARWNAAGVVRTALHPAIGRRCASTSITWPAIGNVCAVGVTAQQPVVAVQQAAAAFSAIDLTAANAGAYEYQISLAEPGATELHIENGVQGELEESLNIEGLMEQDVIGYYAIKRTFQPSMLRRKRKHGFLRRLKTKSGRRVLKNRLLKGRKFMSV